MNHTANVDPAPNHAIDDEIRDEPEKDETTKISEQEPDPIHRNDSEIFDDELSFVRSVN